MGCEALCPLITELPQYGWYAEIVLCQVPLFHETGLGIQIQVTWKRATQASCQLDIILSLLFPSVLRCWP